MATVLLLTLWDRVQCQDNDLSSDTWSSRSPWPGRARLRPGAPVVSRGACTAGSWSSGAPSREIYIAAHSGRRERERCPPAAISGNPPPPSLRNFKKRMGMEEGEKEGGMGKEGILANVNYFPNVIPFFNNHFPPLTDFWIRPRSTLITLLMKYPSLLAIFNSIKFHLKKWLRSGFDLFGYPENLYQQK